MSRDSESGSSAWLDITSSASRNPSTGRSRFASRRRRWRTRASPSRIDVLLESRDAWVGARLADDGSGFAVEAALADVRPGHMGLATMRERVELAGGWLRIDSAAEGTAVSFWIPDGAHVPALTAVGS